MQERQPAANLKTTAFATWRPAAASMAPRERQSNFELLRLTAMVLIVVQHYSTFTNFAWDRSSPSHRMTNEIFNMILSTPGKVGVNIFLMMTGYFLNGRPIKATSIMRTWIQVVMWSWMIFGVTYVYKGVPPSLYRPLLFPVTGHGYWFVSSYIAVMFCSGWIAAFSKNATPAQYITGLVAMLILMSVLDWNVEMRYCNTQWFIFMMSWGAFIRRFKERFDRVKTRTLAALLGVLLLFNWGTVTYFTIHSEEQWVRDHLGPTMLMRNNWSIEVVLFATLLLLLTTRIDIKSQLINTAASCTLGVYLIHENQLLTPRFWQEWIHAEYLKDFALFPILMPIHAAVVYIGFTSLEYARICLLGKVEEYLALRLGTVAESIGDYINTSLRDPINDTELV